MILPIKNPESKGGNAIVILDFSLVFHLLLQEFLDWIQMQSFSHGFKDRLNGKMHCSNVDTKITARNTALMALPLFQKKHNKNKTKPWGSF